MSVYVEDPFWDSCLVSLARPGASEFVANDVDSFFVTHNGRKERINAPAMSERAYLEGIKKYIIPFVKSELDWGDDNYLYEGHYRVPGSRGFEGRCHIMLPPVSLVPRVTMTKIAVSTNTIESIAATGSMSSEMLAFLIAAVKAKMTIVLSGQSGAGKTTTLQALTRYFDEQDRVAVGEDLPEIKLSQPNAAYLQTLPWRPGMDRNKVADLSWVVQQFLRMRPDRVIIGETRGKEFADFLTATNSGMSGSMTTIHANDPVGALDKMTEFALEGSSNSSIRSINKKIGTAVDLVVQLERINGKHRMSYIEEVTSTVGASEDARLTSQTLYSYNPETDDWTKDGMMTDAMKKLFVSRGIDVKPFYSSQVGSRLAKHSAARQPAPVQRETPGFDDHNPFRRSI